jgi:hypothetical protein
MSVRLTEGLNGLALQFTQNIDDGYSFIDITDALVTGYNYVSFYASEDLKVFLGTESKYTYLNIPRSWNINIKEELSYEDSNIRSAVIQKPENSVTKYYLIVASSGVIDDIVISSNSNSVYSAHTKNISILGFDLFEAKPQGSRYRMTMKTHKDYKPYQAGLMSDGYIRTTSSVDWYITQIFDINNDEDFKKCKLINIGLESNYLYTQSRTGYIETLPIHIGHINNIKKLIFKINSINFDNMKDFTTSIYISDRYDGEYRLCSSSKVNLFEVVQENLNNYIKIKIEVPTNKYIDNVSIFAEYTSSDENPLSVTVKESGYIESKVYDLQEITNCMVKSIDIEDVGNINRVGIYIRSSNDTDRLDVWSDWHEIKLRDDLKLKEPVKMDNVRFLQLKITVKSRDAYIKFKGIDIEIR